MKECLAALERLEETSGGPLGDYLRTWELSESNLHRVYYVARALQRLHSQGANLRLFGSGVAVSNFRDKSTRTKSAFHSACDMVGLSIMDFDEGRSQVSHGETTRESAVMLSFLTEVMGIRDDLFLDHGCAYQEECARAFDESVAAGVLPTRPTLVNLQCDRDHPTQSMADLIHLSDLFGGLAALRGKRVAFTWAHSPSYGKPLSVPQGVVALLPRLGVDVVLAHPPEYPLLPEVCATAARFAQQHGGGFSVVDSMEEAFRGADVVYPKSWMPMTIARQRSALYAQGASSGSEAIKTLESTCLAMNAKYTSWACTEAMMALTTSRRDGSPKPEAHYMHCLPADITGVSCKNGEVDASVFDRHRLDTYRQASHKPYVIASAILLSRFSNPVSLLQKIAQSNTSRFV